MGEGAAGKRKRNVLFLVSKGETLQNLSQELSRSNVHFGKKSMWNLQNYQRFEDSKFQVII